MSSGLVTLFGSGETGKHGRFVQEQLLARYRKPIKVAILETPAGFQPNIDVVSGKLRTFYEHNLQNFKPDVSVVSARKKGSLFDPDDPAIANQLAGADFIFAGPGSPTYAARNLSDTRAWAQILGRLDAGATIVLSSAAVLAASSYTMPVYEIFKAGYDPYWVPGLDLLSRIGLDLVTVPHWNNAEGGTELDTSRCFVGVERFSAMLDMLPVGTAVFGIDEHTAAIFDPGEASVTIRGAGTATLIAEGESRIFSSGDVVPFASLRLHAIVRQ